MARRTSAAGVAKTAEQRHLSLMKGAMTMNDGDDNLKGTDATPPVRQNARRGTSSNVPRIPRGDVWLDCDVAEYLHVCTRTVKRIMKDGPRPGELDLRLARPVFIGDRRWFAENVKELVRTGMANAKTKGAAQ